MVHQSPQEPLGASAKGVEWPSPSAPLQGLLAPHLSQLLVDCLKSGKVAVKAHLKQANHFIFSLGDTGLQVALFAFNRLLNRQKFSFQPIPFIQQLSQRFHEPTVARTEPKAARDSH